MPDSYNTLVTALEAHEEVPKMEVITEKLLHAEKFMKEKSSPDSSGDKAMMTKRYFKGNCKKYGHIQKNCIERIKAKERSKQGGSETKARSQRPAK